MKGNGTYEFGYDTRGGRTGARFFRHEEKGVDGRVRGQYGFVDANDDLHVILYVTDALGHRIRTETHKIEGYGRELSRMLEEASSSADVKDQINILLERRKSNPTVTTSSASSSTSSTSTVASTDPPATTTQTFRTTRGTNLFSDFEPYFSDEDPPVTTLRPTLRSLLRSTAFTSSSSRHSTPRPLDRDLPSASVLTRPPTSRDGVRGLLDYDDVDRLVSLLDNVRSRTTPQPRPRDFSTPTAFSTRDDFTSAPSPRPSTFEDQVRELARSTQSPRREQPDAGTAQPSPASLLPLALGIPVPLRKSLSEDQSDKLRDYLSRILRGDGGESGAIVLGRLNANAFRGSKMSDVLRSLGLIQSDFDDVIRGSDGDPLAVYFDPTAGREPQRQTSNNRANSKRINEGIVDGGIIDGGIIDGGIIDGGIIGEGGRGFLKSSITSRPLEGDTGGKNLGGEFIDGGIIDGGIIGGTRDDGIIDGGIIDGGIIGGRISTRGKSGRGFNNGDIIDGGIIDGGIIDDGRTNGRVKFDNFNNGRRGKTIDQPTARDFASQPREPTRQHFGNAKSLLTPPPLRPSSRRPSTAGGSSKTSLLDSASLIDQLIAFHKPEYPEGFQQRESFKGPSEASGQRGRQQGSIIEREKVRQNNFRENAQNSDDRSFSNPREQNANRAQNQQFLNFENRFTQNSNRDKQLISSSQNLNSADDLRSGNQPTNPKGNIDLEDELRALLERLSSERQQSRPVQKTDRQNSPSGDVSQDDLRLILERLTQERQQTRPSQNSNNQQKPSSSLTEEDIQRLVDEFKKRTETQQPRQLQNSNRQNRPVDSLRSIVDSLRAETKQPVQNPEQNRPYSNLSEHDIQRLVENLRTDTQQSRPNGQDRGFNDARNSQQSFQNSNRQNTPPANSGDTEQINRFQNNNRQSRPNENIETNTQQSRPIQNSNIQNNQQSNRPIQDSGRFNNQQPVSNQGQNSATFNDQSLQKNQPVQNTNNNQQVQNQRLSGSVDRSNAQNDNFNNPVQQQSQNQRSNPNNGNVSPTAQNNKQINSHTQNTQPVQGKQISETQTQVEGPVKIPEVLHYIPSPDLSTGRPSDYQPSATPRPNSSLGKSSEPLDIEPTNTGQKSNDNGSSFDVNVVSPIDEGSRAQPNLVRPLSVSSLSPNRSPVFINSTVYFTTTAIPDIVRSNFLRPRLRQSGQFAKELRQESEPGSKESDEQDTNGDSGSSDTRINQPGNSLDLETGNAREKPREGQSKGIGTASLGSSGHIPSKIETIVLPAFFDTTPGPLPATPKTTRPTTTAPTLRRPPPTTQQTTKQPFPTTPPRPPPSLLRGTNHGRLSHFPLTSQERGAFQGALQDFRRIVPTNSPLTKFPPTTPSRSTTSSRFQSLRKPHSLVTTLPPIHLPTTAAHPTTTAITQVFNRALVGTPDSSFLTSAEVTPRGRALSSKPPPIIVNNPPIHLTTVLPPSVALLRSHHGLPRVRPEDVVPVLHHGPPLIPTLRGPTFPQSLRVRSYRLGSGSGRSR
ncbi:uncharacterized protein LOC122244016 [Penaeus japonicus]|uniref:uncharacterized protein LOC122244016 n=1 Tax=Penaeus japonicus TaxID=27405 RepID=UPI001C70F27E|nr:uncharacterized protein LOC122244016 [Penaeus japonicus]